MIFKATSQIGIQVIQGMGAHSVVIEKRAVESIYIGIYPGIGDPHDEMFKLSMNIT